MIKKGIPLYKRDPKILARDLIDTNIKMHEYKRRIDKAIEYIKNDYDEENYSFVPKKRLLEILGDKENESS